MRPRLAVLAAVPIVAGVLVAGCASTGDTAESPPANGKVTVTATEYAFAPTAITAKAGRLKVTLANKGHAEHELVVLKTGQAADALKVGGSARVSESDSVGEVSETAAGATKTTTLDLKPGKYVYVCNIPGHYSDGMYGTLTVK